MVIVVAAIPGKTSKERIRMTHTVSLKKISCYKLASLGVDGSVTGFPRWC